MPYDGSGNYNRIMRWQNDATAGIKIKADRHDQEDDGFASALSQCLTRDGQSQPSADIPLNGKKIVNLGAPVNPTDAATMTYAQSIGTHIHSATAKALPVDADEFVLSDSVATPTTWTRAKTTFLQLKTAIFTAFGGLTHAAAAKATLVDADEFSIADSVSTPDPWGLKKHTWAQLKTMIGIGTDQRLAPTVAAGSADCNLMLDTGWYFVAASTANAPNVAAGFLHAFQSAAAAQVQVYYQGAGTLTYTRFRHPTVASGAWSAWVETTSANALLKKVDGIIDGGGYTQVPVPNTIVAGAYTPSPLGGNLKQVDAVAGNWTFNAPSAVANNFTMVVLINNAVATGTVTFAGFQKVTGVHPPALGAWSLCYITKMAAIVTIFVEPSA